VSDLKFSDFFWEGVSYLDKGTDCERKRQKERGRKGNIGLSLLPQEKHSLALGLQWIVSNLNDKACIVIVAVTLFCACIFNRTIPTEGQKDGSYYRDCSRLVVKPLLSQYCCYFLI